MEDCRNNYQGLSDVPWLLEHHVHMKNPEKVLEKINSIVQGGKEKLQVIFDFDRTITKPHENGVPTISSFGLLENLPTTPPEMKEEIDADYKKYLPIEMDPNLSDEEKIPYMVQWWMAGIERLKGMRWDPEEINEFLLKNQQPLRKGTVECFEELQSAGVPVLVFSAGVGDVVKSLLLLQGILTPNVHVVSNFLKFEDGKVAGSLGDVIHVFNKNEQLIQNTPYYEELSGRINVILLGDSTGDAKMADGVPHNTVIKIGFLNSRIEECLEQYKDLFDIVLTDDQTMDVLHHILKPALSS